MNKNCLNKIKAFSILLAVTLLAGCGDSPSNLGNMAKEKLTQQKQSFESFKTQNSIRSFVNNSHWSPEMKRSANSAITEALSYSKLVNPDFAKSTLESTEMGLACVLTLIKTPEEMDAFINNTTGSISNNESRINLLNQLNNAKNLVTTSAITKANCK